MKAEKQPKAGLSYIVNFRIALMTQFQTSLNYLKNKKKANKQTQKKKLFQHVNNKYKRHNSLGFASYKQDPGFSLQHNKIIIEKHNSRYNTVRK